MDKESRDKDDEDKQKVEVVVVRVIVIQNVRRRTSRLTLFVQSTLVVRLESRRCLTTEELCIA